MNAGVMNIKVNRSSRAFSSKDCTGGKLTLASLKLLVGHSNRLGIYVMVVLSRKKMQSSHRSGLNGQIFLSRY